MLFFLFRKGIQRENIRFIYEHIKVLGDQTPKMLEMENGDEIDARTEQHGGGEGDEADPAAAEATITIAVKDAGGEVMNFKVKKTTKFEKIFGAYASRCVQYGSYGSYGSCGSCGCCSSVGSK